MYHQVQAWLGEEKDPVKYGWIISGGSYEPVTAILPAAPDNLIRLDKCGCLSDCSTKRCRCRKYETACSIYCGCDKSKCRNDATIAVQPGAQPESEHDSESDNDSDIEADNESSEDSKED